MYEHVIIHWMLLHGYEYVENDVKVYLIIPEKIFFFVNTEPFTKIEYTLPSGVEQIKNTRDTIRSLRMNNFM